MKPNLEKVCNLGEIQFRMQISITMLSPKKEQAEVSKQMLRTFATPVLVTAKEQRQTRSPLTEAIKSIQPR